jgi:hypothetical protein
MNAKQKYALAATQQTRYQSATKAILAKYGILPINQGVWFAFNDKIFGLCSKFGNGDIGKETVQIVTHIICREFQDMLQTQFDFNICSEILTLYRIKPYTIITLEIQELLSLLDISVSEQTQLAEIQLNLLLLTGITCIAQTLLWKLSLPTLTQQTASVLSGKSKTLTLLSLVQKTASVPSAQSISRTLFSISVSVTVV